MPRCGDPSGSLRDRPGRADSPRIFVFVVTAVVVAQFVLANVEHLFINAFVDFDAYYTAAVVLREGKNPYDPAPLFSRDNTNRDFVDAAKRVGTLHSHGSYEHVHPYIYPPLLGVLLVPLTIFTNGTAESLWHLLNLALVAGLILVLARTLRLSPGVPLALAVVLVLSFEGLDQTLAVGQVNVLVAFLVFAAVGLFVRGHSPAASALLLALGIAIKLQPAVFLGYFLLVRRFRYVVLCLAAVVALHVPIVLLLGTAPLASFVRDVGPHLAAGVPFSFNQSLPGLVLRLAGVVGFAADSATAIWATRVASLLFLGFTVRVMRLPDAGDHVYNLSLVTIALLVIAPITTSAHLLLLFLPLGYVVKSIEDGPARSPGVLIPFVAAYVLLGVVPQVFYDNERLPGLLTVFASVRLWGMLLLMYCVWRVGGRPRGGHPLATAGG